jgi:hypothetical protein
LKRALPALWLVLLILVFSGSSGRVVSQAQSQAGNRGPFLGFDRNDYPGDGAWPALRKTFRYTSYWLNHPPGESANSWAGKRAILRQNGFGFLVLFTGRTDAEIKAAMAQGKNTEQLGAQDGKDAVAAAQHEGFQKNVLIFLDQEEGGRLFPEQAAYLFAWIDAVRANGARAGVYCSGIDVQEGSTTISTARDIAEREVARSKSSTKSGSASKLVLWIANDACPPAPGCATTAPQLESGVPKSLEHVAKVWQYAQSPRRLQFSGSCPQNQSPDGNCYAPGMDDGLKIYLDLDVADSPDPSEASY